MRVACADPQLYRVMSERAVRSGGNPGAPYFLAAGCAVIAQLLLFTVRPAARRGGGGSAERWHKGAVELGFGVTNPRDRDWTPPAGHTPSWQVPRSPWSGRWIA